MLDINNSRMRPGNNSRMNAMAESVVLAQEGACLVYTMEDGVAKVKPSAGTTGERFAGFALNGPTNVTIMTFVETVTVPASSPYTVTLARTPSEAPKARFTANGAAVAHQSTTGGVDATAKFNVTGRVATFHSADAGKEVRIVGSYAPTVIEAQAQFGEYVNNTPHAHTGMTGTITDADILYITNFDPTSNWWGATPGPVYTGANGIITLESGGTELPAVKVIQAPRGDHAYLGIQVDI